MACGARAAGTRPQLAAGLAHGAGAPGTAWGPGNGGKDRGSHPAAVAGLDDSGLAGPDSGATLPRRASPNRRTLAAAGRKPNGMIPAWFKVENRLPPSGPPAPGSRAAAGPTDTHEVPG